MDIQGTLSLKVDDEQLDQIVIMHCQKAASTCVDIIELERYAMKTNGALRHAENIRDYQNYVEALNTVITYFGGKPIYIDDTPST